MNYLALKDFKREMRYSIDFKNLKGSLALAVLAALTFIIIGMLRNELVWIACGALIFILFSYSVFDVLIRAIKANEELAKQNSDLIHLIIKRVFGTVISSVLEADTYKQDDQDYEEIEEDG